MSINILFAGGTTIDFIQKSRGRASTFFTAAIGGGITNSAIIGAKLGLKTAMISRIGKDPLGDFAIRFLQSSKVDTKGVIQGPCYTDAHRDCQY